MTLKARKILVGLDFTAADDSILTFLAENIEAFEAAKFSFLHVVEDNVPQEAKEQLKHEIAGKVSQKIKEKVSLGAHLEIRVEFKEPQQTIRKAIDDEKIDYLVLGNKATDKKEVKPNELVRKPACSIILVPQNYQGKIEKIGVPTDFSDISKLAFQDAFDFGEFRKAEIAGFHSYQVPSGYHKSGMDHHQFAEVMEKHAKEDAAKYKKELSTPDLSIKYMYQEDKDAAESIAHFVENEKIDMLVLSSKGRSAAASLVMGSVAAKVIEKVRFIPLLIVKKREQNMDMIDALKKV